MNREKVMNLLTNAKAMSYVDMLRPVFKDLPHLPLSVREILVKIIPWLAIVGAIIGAIGGLQDLLAAFGISRVDKMVGSSSYLAIIGIANLIAAYIAFLSFPLLKERNYNGWLLLFWSTALSVVMSLVSLVFGIASPVAVIISALIGFYLTYEIESLYTTSGKASAKVTETVETIKDTAKSVKTAKKSTKR
jgi:uncharacterized membrane protein YuzA (DUF378 family)